MYALLVRIAHDVLHNIIISCAKKVGEGDIATWERGETSARGGKKKKNVLTDTKAKHVKLYSRCVYIMEPKPCNVFVYVGRKKKISSRNPRELLLKKVLRIQLKRE